LEKLTSAFRTQSETETRQEKIANMAAAANSVEPLLNDYLKTRSEFNDIITEFAETLIRKATAFQSKQSNYQALMRQLDPQPSRDELAISDKARQLASASHFNHPPLEYDQAIALAENLLAAKINKAAQEKRRTEFEALRKEPAKARAA